MKGHKNPYDGITPASCTGQTIPSFRRDNHATGSGAGTSSKAVIVFNSNVAATIRHIIVQTSAACTLQLLLNQQPFSLPIAVGAGAIIRFAGTLIANNESLSISVSANSTLNFEVVWVKEFHVEHITTDTAVVYAGASTGANTNVDIFDSTGQTISADGSGNLDTIGIAPKVIAGVDTIPQTIAAPAGFVTTPVITPRGYKGVTVTIVLKTSAANITLQLQLQNFYDGSVTNIAWAQTGAISLTSGADRVCRLLLYPTSGNVTFGGAGGAAVNGPLPFKFQIVFILAGTGWVNPNTAQLDGVFYEYYN